MSAVLLDSEESYSEAREACRRERADDARDAAIAQVERELAAAMTAAMSGLREHVPGVRTLRDGRKVEQTDSPMEALLFTLDNVSCAEAFLLALARSECPLMAGLRAKLVAQYAKDNAEDIASARGLA